MAQEKLAQRVSNFWKAQDRSAAFGLSLLHDCLVNVRDHRDWDALASFVGKSGSDIDNVKRIVRAAFGDRLTFNAKKAKNHPTGVAFDMSWKDGEVVQFSNTYGMVQQVLDHNSNDANKVKRGFRDVALHKELKKTFAKPKVEHNREELIELLAKATLAKMEGADMGIHDLLKAVEAKATALKKAADQKAAEKKAKEAAKA